MGVILYSGAEIERLRQAGRAAAETLAFVAARVAPSVTTAQIEAWVRADTARRGGRPSQLGYRAHGSPPFSAGPSGPTLPFPAAVCTSRNAVVCHGIPSAADVLAPGDIVNVDVTTELGGFHGDTSATLFVGEPGPEARHVVDVAKRCRDAGILVTRDGCEVLTRI